jgi:AmmeMemoRadiSam system protein A
LDQIDIEISILTAPQPLDYTDSVDLLSKLRTDIDGVIIRHGGASATFLPQVWEQLPRKEDFLNHLCQKAGLASDMWRTSKLKVLTYQVQYFDEEK